jgi:hypothetical protein
MGKDTLILANPRKTMQSGKVPQTAPRAQLPHIPFAGQLLKGQ